MSENERTTTRPGEPVAAGGLGNPFQLGDGPSVTVEHGVYRESLPLAGRTIADIRRIVGPRFDVGADAVAFVDGNVAGESTVVRTGQELRFMHHAGEKGQEIPEIPPEIEHLLFEGLPVRNKRRRVPAPKVVVEGAQVTMTTPEGRVMSMDLESLLDRMQRDGPTNREMDELVLADGIKWIVSRRPVTIVVWQVPPAVQNLKWIANDSPVRYGAGARYRQVRIALPYLVVFAIFSWGRDGTMRLTDANECFFRNEPLRSVDDPLYYPALLNCSKFDHPSKPLSWICTQHLRRRRLPRKTGLGTRMRTAMGELMRCLLDSGFNYSSEDHELSSWFSESTGVDPRVSTIERWEQATTEDPMFVCEIPWLATGHSVRQVARRCLDLHAIAAPAPRTSVDLARVLTNHGEVRPDQGELQL